MYSLAEVHNDYVIKCYYRHDRKLAMSAATNEPFWRRLLRCFYRGELKYYRPQLDLLDYAHGMVNRYRDNHEVITAEHITEWLSALDNVIIWINTTPGIYYNHDKALEYYAHYKMRLDYETPN